MEQDPRLTNLQNGQYRILRDGYHTLVPKGSSTTKPQDKEIVETNLRIDGTINKSFFNRPRVRFYNAFKNSKYFDIFDLVIQRKDFDFDKIVDLINDVDFEYLYFRITIEFIINGEVGIYDKIVKFERQDLSFVSDTLHFTDIPFLDGSFTLIIETNTQNTLEPLNHEFNFKILYDKIFYVTNEVKAQLEINDFNNDIPLYIYSFNFDFVKGG